MQAQTPNSAAKRKARDFDFGAARREAGAPVRPHGRYPALAAGLVALAFAVALFTPVEGRAESRSLPGGAEVIQVRDFGPGRGGHGPDRARQLPRVCAIAIDERAGQSWVSGECLRQRGVRADLPRDCALNSRIFGQRDRLYPEKCLRRAGFNIGR